MKYKATYKPKSNPPPATLSREEGKLKHTKITHTTILIIR